MSHKDAPPETESQTSCREWWTKAQPHIARAWGRAKDGAFFADESRLLHEYGLHCAFQQPPNPALTGAPRDGGNKSEA